MIVRVIMRMLLSVGISGANTFDMVVMAFLRQTLMRLKANNLFAIFTQQAIHIVIAAQNAAHAIFKGIDHTFMVIEITGFEKLNIRELGRHFIGD